MMPTQMGIPGGDMMLITRRRALAGAGAAFVCHTLFADALAANPATTRWAGVQSLLDKYVADRRYAGVAAALSYGGAPVSFLTAGTLAFDSKVAITPDSLFRIYSLTKPVTGIAAMLLVEDGRIALDQPVGEVLPEMHHMTVAIDPKTSLKSRPAARPMTMRQLITHTSGMSNWQPFLGNNPLSVAYRERGLTPGSYGARQQILGRASPVRGLQALIEGVADVPLIAEPGTAWNYSIGFDVMGAVIERVTGRGLDVFMRERLFKPLGMNSTGFTIAPSDVGRMTTLYDRRNGQLGIVDEGPTSVWLQQPTLLAGGGGLVSSVWDLIRFAGMLLGKGEFEGKQVMKRETARLALSNILPEGVRYAPTGGFGAGASVVMPGVVSESGPPGTYSALGSSSTLLSVDPARRGIAVFFAQLMPEGGPAAAIYRREFNAAVNADLQTRGGAERH